MASALERRIDDLYKTPPGQFVIARGALARTLGPEDARRVKALAKPTVVPWAVNQLHWHRRPVYDRLLKSGARRRAAEIAALGGGRADVGSLAHEHRQAIAEAVRVATELAEGAGVTVDGDPLARMLEAVSIAARLAEPHGRLTKPIAPSGFEALAGVVVRGSGGVVARPTAIETPSARRATLDAQRRADDEKRAAEARRRQMAIARAEAALATARRDEMRARAAWDAARKQVVDAERALDEARQAGGDGNRPPV